MSESLRNACVRYRSDLYEFFGHFPARNATKLRVHISPHAWPEPSRDPIRWCRRGAGQARRRVQKARPWSSKHQSLLDYLGYLPTWQMGEWPVQCSRQKHLARSNAPMLFPQKRCHRQAMPVNESRLYHNPKRQIPCNPDRRKRLLCHPKMTCTSPWSDFQAVCKLIG
jgi:hypothetical protein